MMRDGRITSLFERGEGDDAGRYRVTFRDGARSVRLIVDASGHVLKRTRTPFARRNAARGGRLAFVRAPAYTRCARPPLPADREALRGSVVQAALGRGAGVAPGRVRQSVRSTPTVSSGRRERDVAGAARVGAAVAMESAEPDAARSAFMRDITGISPASERLRIMKQHRATMQERVGALGSGAIRRAEP